MMRRKRRTVAFGDVAEEVLRKADPSGKRHGARAVGAWRAVVRPEIAAHTHGFALRESGELVVFVDTAAWANDLSLCAGDLVRRMNEEMGDTSVRSLRFTVSRKVAEEAEWLASAEDDDEFYAPDATEPAALDEVEMRQVEYAAAVVKDEDLRAIALRVMVADLERRKGARAQQPGTGSEPEPEDGAEEAT